MKKEKVIVILSVLLALAVILAGFYFYKYTSLTSNTPKETVACKDLGNPFLIDSCYLQTALSGNDARTCGNIISANIRDVCYIEVNKVLKKADGCDKITDIYYMKPKCFAESGVVKKSV